MTSDYFQELKRLIEKFPGVGPRQASRFIWAMLDFEQKDREKLSVLINSLDKNLVRCEECFRANKSKICSFCLPNSQRDHARIMVLERDSDLLNIEKSKIYSGLYHLLGGAIDPLESASGTARERIKALYSRVMDLDVGRPSGRPTSLEIILAISPTKLGEFTASYITKVLEPLSKSRNLPDGKAGIKISRLARGLATGTDLEYADETTLRQALDNRK